MQALDFHFFTAGVTFCGVSTEVWGQHFTVHSSGQCSGLSHRRGMAGLPIRPCAALLPHPVLSGSKAERTGTAPGMY